MPDPLFARNPLSVNGLGALGVVSSASVEASTDADQASNASVLASTAPVQPSSGTVEASGRPVDGLSGTERASTVAFELSMHACWRRSASVQGSSARA